MVFLITNQLLDKGGKHLVYTLKEIPRPMCISQIDEIPNMLFNECRERKVIVSLVLSRLQYQELSEVLPYENAAVSYRQEVLRIHGQVLSAPFDRISE